MDVVDPARLRALMERMRAHQRLPRPAATGVQLQLLGMPPPPHVDARFVGECVNLHALRLQVQEIVGPRTGSRYRVVAGPFAGKVLNVKHMPRPTVTIGCPTCKAEMALEIVAGEYSDEAPCNGLCMGARGPKCECRCAGVNHGRWFG